ncbi:hypothetical protein ACFW5D_03210 [Streptomyces sp. NPDC058770]|uniref:hypothetical protein n=1 Tax=Streptomyces sp. NPDC058770 TaxID=3346631 RepID=UPI0036C919C2
MAVARRPLLTATAAGTLLAALWFVPSANATDERTDGTGGTTTSVTGPTGRSAGSAHRSTDPTDRGTDPTVVSAASDASAVSLTPVTANAPGASGSPRTSDAPGTSDAPDAHGDGAATAVSASSSGLELAATGSGVDTTPYLFGGAAFLGVGAAFVTYSIRRADTQSP